MDRIRVVAAHTDPQMRDIVADLFALAPDFELVGFATDVDTAIALTATARPDIAIVAANIGTGGGAHACREILRAAPATRVVALSADEGRDAVVAMFRAGAVGYLVKGSTSSRQMIDVLRRTAAGEMSLRPPVSRHVSEELTVRLHRMHGLEEQRRETRARIHSVLASGDLDIAFQPIVDLRTDIIVGVEALARFSGEPPRPPNVWFSEAETVGLSLDLELLAVRRALEAAAVLPEGVYVAVNVSPDTAADETLLALVLAARPAQTVLEITEHAAVNDYVALNQSLEPLRAAGVRIAIDDAGAGFASLRHILLMAPDAIKLDVSLTRDIHQDRPRQALAKALITFAAESEATIVAEGIETTEELAVLRDFGVTYGQGYLLGRPAPPAAVTVPRVSLD